LPLGLAWITVDLLTTSTVPTEILQYDGGAREDLVMGGEGLNDTRSLKVEGGKGMWFEDHERHELSAAKKTVHYLSSTVDLPRRIFHGLGNVTWLSAVWLQIPSDKVPG